jgi:hypothetical protein
VQVDEGTTTLGAPTTLDLVSESAKLFYAGGESGNNTVKLENKIVKNVI